MEAISLQDALDYCLDNPHGLSARELLEAFPQHREELALLLGLTAAIESTPPPVPAARRADIKARIVSAAVQMRHPQSPASPAPTAPEVVPAPALPPPRQRTSGPVPLDAYTKRRTPLLLRPGFITAVAAALILAFVWWSARGALPDSPFYNVRIASENFAINLAGSDANKVSAHLNAATSRLYDLREMQRRDRLPEAQEAVVNYEEHLTGAQVLWRGLTAPELEVTEQLYVSSVAGMVTFENLNGERDTLPAPYRQDIAEAEQAIEQVGAEAEQALVLAGRDPASVLAAAASSDTELAALVASLVPTLPVPTEPGAPSTATGSAAQDATPTVVAVLPPTEPAVVIEPPADTPTAFVEPQATPEPPSATPPPPATQTVPPPPPTDTPRPVPPTRTPRPLPPVATQTPVIVAATVCDLNVSDITVTCRGQAGVGWVAVVNNRGNTAVTASWTAQLEVQNQGGGGFNPMMSMSGTDVFPPGLTTLNRTLQYPFSPEADKARVLVRLDTSGYACTVPAKQSLDVPACNSQNQGGGQPDRTRTPPGLDNKPTPRPENEPGSPNDPDDKKESGGKP